MAHDVDALRAQLRDRGYLSHGIERWFALDPWSSRAFWLELATVAGKAAVLLALFGALPMVAVMLFRNFPLNVAETLALMVVYGAAWVVVAFAFIVLVALVMKLRPELAVDTPRALLGISIAASALLTGVIAVWWYRFESPPGTAELVVGIALSLLFFLVETIVVSAALLSFSIYELHRVPAIHQKPRGVPMAVAAAVLLALLFLPAYAAQERRAAIEPPQIVTTPTTRRIALVAVDGLTFELLQSRPDLAREFASVSPAAPPPGASTTERWATVGTGVPTSIHGVRSIEGIRFAGGRHLIQTISRADVALHELAPAIRIARHQPLPPTVRRRDFVWEVFAGRGVPTVAVNWWTTENVRDGALTSVAQEPIFAASRGDALRVDSTATALLLTAIDRDKPQFATVYLPALDVVLNRLPLDVASRLAQSVRALDGVARTIQAIRTRGYDVLVIGLPGDGQSGRAVVASTIGLVAPPRVSALDAAPTLAALLGFPLSAEMPGRSLAGTEAEPRISGYGTRRTAGAATKVDEEYYESLKSLGYIQ